MSIDKFGLPAITKFSYSRELLHDKMRKVVEALPYSAEGYNRAVAILKEKYGKEREILKAYQSSLLNGLKNRELVLAADGRSDSPGHSAKYGCYTMMDLENNKIIVSKLVQVILKLFY